MRTGPVDFAVFSFPGNRFTGAIAPALGELMENGTIRVLDLVFVTKNEQGVTGSVELLEVDDETRTAFERLGLEVNRLLSDEDIAAEAELLEPGSSAALIVWENVWAGRLADAIRASGGELIDSGHVPPELVDEAWQWADDNPDEEGQ